MSDWKIKFDGGERVLDSDVVTFGRASDNDVAFPQDSNVSRYHAEIEYRHGDHFLIDLGSSNGTTLNGTKVKGDVRLASGDIILLGGSSAIEVISDASDAPEDAAQPTADPDTPEFQVGANLPPIGSQISGLPAGAVPTAAAGQTTSGGGATLLIAGAVCGLAVVCIAAAAVFYLSSTTSSCEAKAVITKPEAGDTIMTPTEVELEAENMGCVSTAVYTLDGEEIQRTDEAPFTVTLDPKDFPEMSDGLDHKLEIVLIDEQGQQIAQNSPVLLAFETRVVAKEEPTPEARSTNDRPQQQPTGSQSKKVTLIEIQEMSNRFVKQFSPNFKYNVNNRQFLEEVQKKTAEYATEGYFERAAQYRDAISVAYVRENNLDAPLGFILAMSRSKFILDKKGKDEGLWKMSNDFVTANGYNGPCGTETLADASQNCAAKASALYMKAIVFGVFDGDSIYGASVFGKSTQDAGAWKATLPADRSDIWNTIRTPEERDQIVRFFAAGIVGENPQKFGLTKDRPLSELYRIAM